MLCDRTQGHADRIGKAALRLAWCMVLLGGCAALDQKIIDLQMRGLESRSQAFKEGYRAGCASGYRVGGSFQYQMTKDVMRYDVDTEYQTGWDQAYADCRKIDINR